MAEALFDVIADGHAVAGFDPVAVAQQLTEQLKLTAAQAQRLLGGKTVIAKRALPQAIAEKYCARLSALGVQVHLASCATPQPSPPSTPEPSQWPVLVDYFAGIALPLPAARNSLRYLQRLFFTTAQTLGIAVAYSALVLLSLILLIFYARHFGYLLAAPPLLFSIPIFLIPVFALVGLALLLLRPFYPQRRTLVEPVLMYAQQQPQLFHWLAQLCELSGIPMPQEVAIATQTHHSVLLLDGAKAFWHGQYRLTLSLPALAIGTVRDNSALLIATLGTRAGPTLLRCQRAIDKVNERLNSCLENRDWLSEKVSRLENSLASSMKIVPALLRKIIAQHNRLLTLFSQALQTPQQRLAKYALLEADRLHTLIAGSANFIDNLLQQHQLAEAYRDADTLNRADRIDGNLVDNLPTLIQHYYDSVDPKATQVLRNQWREAVARTTAALPTAGERIEIAEARNDVGLLNSTECAATLLTHQHELAIQTTAALYTELGLQFDAAQLTPTEALTFTATEDILRKQQAALYFNNWFRPYRYWRPADYPLICAMPTGDAAQQLSVCVNEIRRLTPDRARLLNEYERLQNQIQELLIGQLVLAQGRPFQFRYITYDGSSLQPLLEDRQQQIAKVMEQLATQETIMGGRITLGLRLSGQAQRDVESLHRALLLSAGIEARLYKLSLDIFQLEQLVQRHYMRRETVYAAAIKRLEEKVSDACALLQERLKEIPYPLDARYATLNDYIEMLLKKPHRKASASPTLDRAQRLLQAVCGFNEALARSVADCGTIAEEAYNIEPIRLLR